MKILHLLCSNQFSGAENVACTIMKQMTYIESAYCSPDGPIRKALSRQGLTFVPIASVSPKNVKRILKEQKPDLIHAHDMRASLIASLVCGSIPLISHIHSNSPDAVRYSPKSVCYLFAAMRARHILWVSESACKEYAFHRLVQKKSSVLYNTIDIEDVRKKAESDPNSYRYDIVFIGRLTKQKDPKRFLSVLAPVLEACPKARAAIIGDGELADELHLLAQSPPLQSRVEFLGFLENPLKILQESKVLVMTSRWEGTPICALEALALGIPIVSTPTDGLCHLIENGKNGYLDNDNDRLSKYIEDILLDPHKRQALSNEARRRADRDHNILAYQKYLKDIYRL